jgi:hypothetical protein
MHSTVPAKKDVNLLLVLDADSKFEVPVQRGPSLVPGLAPISIHLGCRKTWAGPGDLAIVCLGPSFSFDCTFIPQRLVSSAEWWLPTSELSSAVVGLLRIRNATFFVCCSERSGFCPDRPAQFVLMLLKNCRCFQRDTSRNQPFTTQLDLCHISSKKEALPRPVGNANINICWRRILGLTSPGYAY